MTGATRYTGAGAGDTGGATYDPDASSGCTTGAGEACSIRSSRSSSGGGGSTLTSDSTASCTNCKYLGLSDVARSSSCHSRTSKTC